MRDRHKYFSSSNISLQRAAWLPSTHYLLYLPTASANQTNLCLQSTACVLLCGLFIGTMRATAEVITGLDTYQFYI